MKTIIVKILLSFLALTCFSMKAQDTLISLSQLDDGFSYEIRYATHNNFLGKPLYDCANCMLQENVAKALSKANQYFLELGYRIKIFDCYRPLDVQKAMWEELPNPNYVANPYDGASIHNRGAAVDITLVTLDECFIDMGSDYDHFGKTSHIDNIELAPEIVSNRKLLLEGMKKFGFQPIRTEWWHFSYYNCYQYPILNTPLPCNN